MKRTIIVTGASRGIGLAIVEYFASYGYDVAFCSLRNASLSQALEKLKTKFPENKFLASQVNMSSHPQVQKFAQDALAFFGGSVDILVNNAGVFVPGSVTSGDYSDNLEAIMATNLYSAYWMGKEIIPSMVSRKKGHIFNMSSIAGIQPYPGGGSYAITKYALTGYTDTIRQELINTGVRVTGIFPGATDTDSWASAGLPPERFIQPIDIARLIFTTYSLSESANVEKIIIRPTQGDI